MKSRTTSVRFRKHHTPPAQRRERKERKGMAILFPVFLFVALFSLGLLYVSQSNSVATSGLTIKSLERRAAELKLKNQELELKAAQLRSLATVEQSLDGLNLDARAATAFLPIVPGSVALGE